MFYSKNKIIEYPNKSLLEDLLTRDGEPTEESFTPYYGCASMLREQFSSKTIKVVAEDVLKSDIKDFSVKKAKANDDINRDYDTSQVVDYYMRLEDIDQIFVNNYVKQVLIGYKINNNGLKKQEKEIPSQNRLYDEESEDYIMESDLLEVEHAYSTEEVLEAKAKLPYLLKQLHMGSLYFNGSLLSFIIAAEKCYKQNKGKMGYVPKPSDLVSYGVYRINKNGDITTKFQAKDNTVDPYRRLVAFIQGRNEDDKRGKIYFRAYKELLKVLDVLDIDITREDATKYTSDYIRKIACTYLASNEEYIETYGFIDYKILSMLKEDKLFSVAAKMSNETIDLKRVSLNMLAETIAINTESLRISNPKEWKERPERVNQFLNHFCIMNKLPIKQVSDFDICNGVLVKGDGSYLIISVGKIKDTCNLNAYAVISIAGYLIIVQEIISSVEYLDVNEAILRMKGVSNCVNWYKFSL